MRSFQELFPTEASVDKCIRADLHLANVSRATVR